MSTSWDRVGYGVSQLAPDADERRAAPDAGLTGLAGWTMSRARTVLVSPITPSTPDASEAGTRTAVELAKNRAPPVIVTKSQIRRNRAGPSTARSVPYRSWM
jgi:hypothetical protein